MRHLLLLFVVLSRAVLQVRTASVITCDLCNEVVQDVIDAFRNDLPDEAVADYIAEKCQSRNLYRAEICRGTANIILPTLRHIYKQSEIVQGNICGILLQNLNCPFSAPEQLEWSVKIRNNSHDVSKVEHYPTASQSSIKVLHLADVHWDSEYLEGSNANCGDPLCCRASSGNVTNSTDAAGYWGDYRSCDLPWRTFENAVAHMAKQHPDIAYIIWTGDLVPHDVWSTNRDENIWINERLLNLMKQYFPNTPLYPTLGNHEAHPTDTFAPPEIEDEQFNTNWLYSEAERQWTTKWLPVEASSTIRYGGYYTALVQPGLRIISLNTNYCYIHNWWALYKSQDHASNLDWLNKVLEEAERSGEKVHIISHIPPGNDDCWAIFSREFSKIINRFESTVAAQFYGHTHREEFKVFYDSVNVTRPVNVAFLAGSLTTYIDLNPSYRVYTIDGPRTNSSWAVLDYSTWMFNLTAANELASAKEPEWFELYQAKNEYNLTDLSPSSMDELMRKMLTDDHLFQLYFKNYHKATDNATCNSECRAKLLCGTVTTNFAQQQQRCKSIRDKILGEKQLHQHEF